MPQPFFHRVEQSLQMPGLWGHGRDAEGAALPLILVVHLRDRHSREISAQVCNEAFQSSAFLLQRGHVGDAELGTEGGGVHGAS